MEGFKNVREIKGVFFSLELRIIKYEALKREKTALENFRNFQNEKCISRDTYPIRKQ
jgi:hypothetical protein